MLTCGLHLRSHPQTATYHRAQGRCQPNYNGTVGGMQIATQPSVYESNLTRSPQVGEWQARYGLRSPDHVGQLLYLLAQSIALWRRFVSKAVLDLAFQLSTAYSRSASYAFNPDDLQGIRKRCKQKYTP